MHDLLTWLSGVCLGAVLTSYVMWVKARVKAVRSPKRSEEDMTECGAYGAGAKGEHQQASASPPGAQGFNEAAHNWHEDGWNTGIPGPSAIGRAGNGTSAHAEGAGRG